MNNANAAARREAGEIYNAAAKTTGIYYDPTDDTASKVDLLVVEHILRAVLQTLTPEQRTAILAKVTR